MIKHQTQSPENSCMSACLAMVLGVPEPDLYNVVDIAFKPLNEFD